MIDTHRNRQSSPSSSDRKSDPGSRESNDRLGKVIKKRVRNRYGSDPTYMGFSKKYVVNAKTGRANQVFHCLFCPLKTPKLCNMMDHQKTHRHEKLYECPLCHLKFQQPLDRDLHYMRGSCMLASKDKLLAGRPQDLRPNN